MYGKRDGVCDIDFYPGAEGYDLEADYDCSGCACYSGGAAPKPRDDDDDDDGDDGGSTALTVLGWGLIFIAIAAVVSAMCHRHRHRGVVSAFRPFARVSSPECSGCCFPWRRLVAQEAGAYAPLGGNIDNMGGPAGHNELTIARRSLQSSA